MRHAELGELGVVMLPLPTGIANRLRAWAERIPEDVLAPKGREDEPHVTVKYGLTTLDDAAVAAAVRDFGEITLTFGPLTVFEQPDQDVLVVTVESPQLEALRQKLETAVSWDDQFAGDYRPHATLAYVKKGTAAEWDGDRSFAGESAVVRRAEYVPKGFDDGPTLELVEGGVTRDRSGKFATGGECPEAGCGQAAGHSGEHGLKPKVVWTPGRAGFSRVTAASGPVSIEAHHDVEDDQTIYVDWLGPAFGQPGRLEGASTSRRLPARDVLAVLRAFVHDVKTRPAIRFIEANVMNTAVASLLRRLGATSPNPRFPEFLRLAVDVPGLLRLCEDDDRSEIDTLERELAADFDPAELSEWELGVTRNRSGQFAPGGGGECPEPGCGQEAGHAGAHDVAAKAKAASAPTGLRIREAARRAFTGAPRALKSVQAGPGRQLKVGALGEAVAASWLREQGVAAERLHIRGRNNFPLDLVSWSKAGPILWEAKAGPVSNAPSGQQWRVTNGQPSDAEAEWLKTASDAQKARYNARKIAKAIARKAAVVKEAERVLGVPVQLKTIALIVDPDRNLADVHVFDGVHPLIRWNSTQAKAGYQGSVAWAGKALAEPEEDDAQEDDGGALPPDVEAAMEAQLENEADAWLAGFLEWAREHGGGQVLSGWEFAAEFDPAEHPRDPESGRFDPAGEVIVGAAPSGRRNTRGTFEPFEKSFPGALPRGKIDIALDVGQMERLNSIPGVDIVSTCAGHCELRARKPGEEPTKETVSAIGGTRHPAFNARTNPARAEQIAAALRSPDSLVRIEPTADRTETIVHVESKLENTGQNADQLHAWWERILDRMKAPAGPNLSEWELGVTRDQSDGEAEVEAAEGWEQDADDD